MQTPPTGLDQRSTQLTLLRDALRDAGFIADVYGSVRVEAYDEDRPTVALSIRCVPRVAKDGHLWLMSGRTELADAFDVVTAVAKIKTLLADR